MPLRVYGNAQVTIYVIGRVDDAKWSNARVISDCNTSESVYVNVAVESSAAADTKILWREKGHGSRVVENEISAIVRQGPLNTFLSCGAGALSLHL